MLVSKNPGSVCNPLPLERMRAFNHLKAGSFSLSDKALMIQQFQRCSLDQILAVAKTLAGFKVMNLASTPKLNSSCQAVFKKLEVGVIIWNVLAQGPGL